MDNFTNIKIIEKSLLSALFVENGANLEKLETLEIDDFYDSTYRQIYQSIIDVCLRDDEPFDVALIVENLKNNSKDSKDWYAEVAELIDFTPTFFSIEIYAKKIKEESTKRRRLCVINDFKNNKVTYLELKQILDNIDYSNNNDDDNLCVYDFDYNLDDEQEWLIDYLLPAQEITTLAGLGASGKTTLVAQLALHLLLNKDFNEDIKVCKKIEKVLYLTGEASRKQVNNIFKKLINTINAKDKINKEQIKIIASDNVIFATTQYSKVVKSQFFDKLKRQIDKINPDFVIIDSFMSTNSINFLDGTQVQDAFRIIKDATSNRTALLLHHMSGQAYNEKLAKDDKGVFGSVNILNKLRHVLTLFNNKLLIKKTNMEYVYKDKYCNLTPLISKDGRYVSGVHLSKIYASTKDEINKLVEQSKIETKKTAGRHREKEFSL